MQFAHLADSHLGACAYRKISNSGYNQREEDVCTSFEKAVDKIIELKPDFVLHAGDLFDSARPTNRIISFALKQIGRLLAENINVVIISGNHDTPKQRYIGSVFQIFERIDPQKKLLRVIYNDEYSPVEFGNAVIHCVPQCSTDEIFKVQLNNIKKDAKKKNILMLHAGITGMKAFSHGDSNELLLDVAYLEKNKFDYVALGHYHNFVEVAENAYFSGSTERMSFNEAYVDFKGFIMVDLSEKTKIRQVSVDTRKMIDMLISCGSKDSVLISSEIEEKMKKADINDKIVRLTVKDIPSHILAALDIKKIRELGAPATHFEPIFEKLNEGGSPVTIKSSIGNISDEFKLFIEGYSGMSKEDKNIYLDEGLKAINEISIP